MARHGSLAEQLAALKAYSQRPQAAAEPLQTNWHTTPANDNDPVVAEDFAEERRVSIRPTIGEIMRSVSSTDAERNDIGQIVKWGKLRFSDGTQTERCTMYGIDGKPIEGDITMPAGAILGASEEQERTLGGSGVSLGNSNAYFAEVFDVDNRQYKPCGKRKRGRNYTRDESVGLLLDAVANTETMPDVEYCEDGFALGTARVADNFIGMKKAPKGSGGSVAWQDLSDKIAEREAWLEVEKSLSVTDRAVLDVAASAQSFASISMKGHKRTAERNGRKKLIAANDNLMAAIKLYSA